jgi:gluconolactonase
MDDVKTLASGLRFPEGPIAMEDGSIVLVEIQRQTLSRVTPDGAVSVVAELGGGPNGAAIGPDGAVYVCNNGGCFEFIEVMGMSVPGGVPESWTGGSIQRVDLATGEVTTLYTESGGHPLRAPNDLVFDEHGGFWFTDHGVRLERSSDRTGLHYAKADGSSCEELVFPLDAPNGIGLSPTGDRLYAAETHAGRVWAWPVTGPGTVDTGNPVGAGGGTLLHGAPDHQLFDSLAVDGEGWVCVGTLLNGGVTAISPDGGTVEHHPLADVLVTNICFAGDEPRAYCTLSGTGLLVEIPWPRPGLRLAYTA